MPTRPQAHITGDQGILQVLRALPPDWITRVATPDYGIDLDLEIPDNTGHLSGLLAKAQVKAISATPQATKRVPISISHLLYWQALPLQVYLFAAFVGSGDTLVLNVTTYIREHSLERTLLTTNKRSHSIPISAFTTITSAVPCIQSELAEYAAHIRSVRHEGPYLAFGAQYVAAIFSAWMHGGNIDEAIDWIRYLGSEEQVRQDLPYLLWLKNDLRKRGMDYKSFLSFVLNIVDIEFTTDEIWHRAVAKARRAAKRARSIALQEDQARKDLGWHPIPERHQHEVL